MQENEGSGDMRKTIIIMSVLLACLASRASSFSFYKEETSYSRLREEMVRYQLAARDITDKRVLAAMAAVPRHLFANSALRHLAYADHPLPIGDGQTISQPYIVALMTQLLELKEGEKILEIGTGSGYQAAVLAHLTDKVFTIEIVESLARKAIQTLRELDYEQVQVKWGDGNEGWEENAPYDAIIITCATPEVPATLFAQLKEGGRLVLPLGNPRTFQTLTVITKVGGKPKKKRISGVRFVPMTTKIKDSKN